MLANKKVYGTMLRLSRNPGIINITRNAGFDFILYDCEHSSYNNETLHDLFVAGNNIGMPSLVRVPNCTKDYISRYLDYGATGIMVPMVNTPEQAREVVKYSKYLPIGDRGYSTGCAHLDFKGAANHTQVMESMNNKIISIVQIETKQAVDNCEQIAAVEGVDVLLIGPNDLSVSLGVPGDLMHPRQLEAMAHVADCCKKHSKAFGLHAGIPVLKKFIDDLTFIMTETDISVLEKGYISLNKSVRELT